MLTELAIAIRARRLKLGISEQQFSLGLNIKTSFLVAIEQGLVDPDINLLYSIAAELGWTPAILMSRAESLTLASEDVQRRMLRSIKTRRQLDSLDRQHERLFEQLIRLKRQAQSIKSCRLMIDESRQAYSPPVDVEVVEQKLDAKRYIFGATMTRVQHIRQACDEHERFIQRFKARNFSVVR